MPFAGAWLALGGPFVAGSGSDPLARARMGQL